GRRAQFPRQRAKPGTVIDRSVGRAGLAPVSAAVVETTEDTLMRYVLLLPLIAAACAAPGARDTEQQALARELAGRAAGAPQSCVSGAPAQNLRVVDAHTIA